MKRFLVAQPIPYQGSKRQLAPLLLPYFPATISQLVEPFVGSAAISLAAAYHRRASRFWLNDANEPLIRLWGEILSNTEGLAHQYRCLWEDQDGNEREFFNRVRQRFNSTHEPADFLYLLARCVKAAVRYNAQGEFNNTPDNRRKGARPKEMHYRLHRTAELLAGRTRLTSWDYKAVLQQCETEDFVYMDPPYQGVCGNRDGRYLSQVNHDEFCDTLEGLNARQIRFAISYDGRTGEKTYGEPLPPSLHLTRIEISAGRSSQATLLGRSDMTYESLYLSSTLIAELNQDTLRTHEQPGLWQGVKSGREATIIPEVP